MFISGLRDRASVISLLFLHLVWIAVFAAMWLNGAIATIAASFIFLLLVAVAYSKWFLNRRAEVVFSNGFARENAFPTSDSRKKLVSIAHWVYAAITGVLAYAVILIHALEPNFEVSAVVGFFFFYFNQHGTLGAVLLMFQKNKGE